MKDIHRRGNWRRAARHLSTIWKARGLLLGNCEAILRKDTWAAPVKLRKLRRGELRMVPRGEGGGGERKGNAMRTYVSAPEIPQDLKVAVGTRRTLARGWFALQWKVCFKPWLPPPAPVGAAGTHIFQLSPAWEVHTTCNIFEQNCISQSCILRFSSA